MCCASAYRPVPPPTNLFLVRGMNAVNVSHPVVGPVSLVDTGHLDISDISNLSQASMHIDTIFPLDQYSLDFDNAFDPSLLDDVQLVNGLERQDTTFYWSIIDPMEILPITKPVQAAYPASGLPMT